MQVIRTSSSLFKNVNWFTVQPPGHSCMLCKQQIRKMTVEYYLERQNPSKCLSQFKKYIHSWSESMAVSGCNGHKSMAYVGCTEERRNKQMVFFFFFFLSFLEGAGVREKTALPFFFNTIFTQRISLPMWNKFLALVLYS